MKELAKGDRVWPESESALTMKPDDAAAVGSNLNFSRNRNLSLADTRNRPVRATILVRSWSESTKIKRTKFAGKVGTGFNEEVSRTLLELFNKVPRSTCPFVDLPEKRAGRYGQGVTASEMKLCHWIEPEIVCQIKFREWTRDQRLRQPVFLGIREDKDAKEVVREEPS